MIRRIARETLLLGILSIVAAPLALAQGANLIVNGGAETGLGTGWTVIAGATESVAYGSCCGFPAVDSPGPPDRGANFFSGGGASPSQIRQVIDVSGSAALIDASAVSFQLSAYLGGFGSQDDNATLSATFLDGSDAAIGSPTVIGPVLAADRGSTTGLLLRSASGLVPANTRSVQIDLVQTNEAGCCYNDGYADNLSLVFIPKDAIAIDVDRAPNSIVSDGNGVMEPEESVFVEPSWKNPTGSAETPTGAASAFTGPTGPDYNLDDAAADYGTIGAGATKGCHLATGNCYQMTVSTGGGARPSTHWDATFLETLTSGDPPKQWTLHVGDSFTDVPRSEPFYKRIETLLHAGITAGCTATTYCPTDPVSRGAMAIFIAKGISGGGANVPSSGTVNSQPYNCSAGGHSLFTDVAPTDLFCKHVHYVATQNVTLGCATGKYCPGDNVLRLDMASFIAKAVVAPAGGSGVPSTYGPDPVTGLSYSCSAGSPNIHFTDVPVTNTFCKHVHYLWARGMITGCSATKYCPADPVTRDTMAKFLSAAFKLSLYGP